VQIAKFSNPGSPEEEEEEVLIRNGDVRQL
jgi:hypothetical protein